MKPLCELDIHADLGSMYQKQAKYKASIEKLRRMVQAQETIALYTAQKSRAQKLLAEGKMPLAMYIKVFELDEDQEKAIALYSRQQPADNHARDFLLDALEKYGIRFSLKWKLDSDAEDEDSLITLARAMS